jgi:molybdopterin converting factor subunit 1
MTSLAQPALHVRVLLFARYAELAGRPEVDLSLPAPATVADVLRQLRGSLPGAERLPDRPLAAVNQIHAQPDAVVHEGDEIAFLPPLAGG